jgi:hypothetical protein
MTTTTPSIEPTIQEQASVVLAHAAGYASHRTVAIGLRSGLLEALASEHATPDELAERPHECRDIDQITERVLASLEPGGWYVISDFPFPDTEQGLRSVPGRITGAIQFFEAQIDDQLLTRATYDHLLSRHGFTELGSFSLTPMHAVTHARKPR